jgi:dimethylhistidine N-methyltransferase
MQTNNTQEPNQPLQQWGFAPEIISALLEQSASISPKFLYDPLGSHLFTAITLLPEYYPTATEKWIFEHYRTEITKTIGSGGVLIDLGAGNCQKAESFFEALRPSSYVAIDFSVDYLKDALQDLQGKYPDISMQAIGMDFSQALNIPLTVPSGPRTFFYPGSSIGNFLPSEALKLLTEIKQQSDKGGLLIGVDLMKADEILKTAYDDPLKITAAFNLNILRSVNSIIGSDFKVEQFKHVVHINHQDSRVELYLESLEDLIVKWQGGARQFKQGECIHTENSHKYTVDTMQNLLNNAGFQSTRIWTDPKNYFAVIYAQ